jgi:hydroxymethylpyrimidine pyrophosphatase-like HAD family hydrolase
MEIKKLVCFDFDDTLCNTVQHDDGKVIWREKFGVEYPHRGWWSKPESLDMDIFPVTVNPYVYQEYLKAVSDPDNYVILATGRIEKLRPEVEAILDNLNLAFDAVYLNTGGDTFTFKRRLFEKLISKIDPQEFIIYDDRYEHLEEFEKWAKTIDCRITIIDVKNKTTKIFK